MAKKQEEIDDVQEAEASTVQYTTVFPKELLEARQGTITPEQEAKLGIVGWFKYEGVDYNLPATKDDQKAFALYEFITGGKKQ